MALFFALRVVLYQSSSELFYSYQAGSVCEIQLLLESSSDWTVSLVTTC